MEINYIPENTNDLDAVAHLKKLKLEDVRKDIAKLLEWLQDAHWPVAEGIAQFLIPYVNDIKDELLFILETNDGMWKYHVIMMLIAHSKQPLDYALISAVKRIAEKPSNIEIEEGVNELAKGVIKSNFL